MVHQKDSLFYGTHYFDDDESQSYLLCKQLLTN